jgi:hypothetical protein
MWGALTKKDGLGAWGRFNGRLLRGLRRFVGGLIVGFGHWISGQKPKKKKP